MNDPLTIEQAENLRLLLQEEITDLAARFEQPPARLPKHERAAYQARQKAAIIERKRTIARLTLSIQQEQRRLKAETDQREHHELIELRGMAADAYRVLCRLERVAVLTNDERAVLFQLHLTFGTKESPCPPSPAPPSTSSPPLP